MNLALRRDVASLCVLYRIYHGEWSEELFDLLPTAEFSNRTVRHKLRYHPHHLDKRVYLHLKGRQRTCSSSGAARGRGRR